MDSCAYKDIAVSETEDGPQPITYHYARSVFDWSSDYADLARLCAYREMGRLETDLCAVYVIACEGSDYCKIGITDNPRWRISGLQTGNWAALSYHAILWVWDGRAKAVEALCHMTAKQRYDVRREWLRTTPSEALALVITAAAALDVQASGVAGVEDTRQDQAACRAHALSTARRLQTREKAAKLGY